MRNIVLWHLRCMYVASFAPGQDLAIRGVREYLDGIH